MDRIKNGWIKITMWAKAKMELGKDIPGGDKVYYPSLGEFYPSDMWIIFTDFSNIDHW